MTQALLFEVVDPPKHARVNNREACQSIKAAHGIWAYKGDCEDWMAMSMPQCVKALEGYGLTDEEKTDGIALFSGYCRLLDDAGLIEYGRTEYETVMKLAQRLSK